jgi:ketosteroid isomerase-like protein
MTPLDTVQHIYAAFGRGDVPAILDCLAEDVDWEYGAFPNPVPWLQPRKGRAAVPGFFEALQAVEFHAFVPLKVFGDAETVLGLVHLDATVRATGKRVVEAGEVHVFQFDAEGKVRAFRHACDSWQHAMALRTDATA